MFPDLEFIKTCLNGLRSRIEKVENGLLKRIEKVEDWAVSETQTTQIVADYFAENPIIESDPTVPAWAKEPTKPTYTAAEIGAQPDMYVTSFDSLIEEIVKKNVVYVASTGSASPIPSSKYPVLFMRSGIDRGEAAIVAYDAAGNTWSGAINFIHGTIGLTERTLTPFKPDGKSYLTFSSPSSFTLAVNDATKHWDGILEYFASDRIWTTWDGTSAISASANGGEYALYLRGNGNTVITGNSENYRWVLDGTDIKCVGNIENLLDYTTVESGGHPTMATSCYSRMFYGCTSLTQPPALPATTLASSCYSNMFGNCTSLTQAPALPATTLASSCYEGMFYGCTSLTQAPVLPATTLMTSCYKGMFYGCTSLTQAPVLPATTLATSCYNNMFYGCTSLTQAPVLPATTLVNYCYEGMFYGCTSLKLSSTKTDEYTQEYRIPSSGYGVMTGYVFDRMFSSTGGTFTGTPEINTTYYLSTDNMIVRETEIVTLNGYVGSMINNALDTIGGEAEFPNWRLIKTISFPADIASIDFDIDDNGNTFSLKEIMLVGTVPAYSGYIYMKPNSTGGQNAIWPTAAKTLRWWAASVNGQLKTMLAVSNTAVTSAVDNNPVCENDTISRLVIGASGGFTADGTMYVYGR